MPPRLESSSIAFAIVDPGANGPAPPRPTVEATHACHNAWSRSAGIPRHAMEVVTTKCGLSRESLSSRIRQLQEKRGGFLDLPYAIRRRPLSCPSLTESSVGVFLSGFLERSLPQPLPPGGLGLGRRAACQDATGILRRLCLSRSHRSSIPCRHRPPVSLR